MPPKTNQYVCTLTALQADQLKGMLEAKGYEMDQIPYSRWRARQGKLTVVAYESGKLTVQGPDTAEFVQFTLEPEVLKEARFGYEGELAKLENPQMFEPHAGIDESGKGDYFGPLVIACAYTERTIAQNLLEAGVADSKQISSEAKILALDSLIRKECAGKFSLILVGPEAYNRLYASFGNLNRLLAWGHAKALEELLKLVPGCPRAISDQFARTEATVRNALQARGRAITLEQHPKAEADVAVAAASILARAEFVRTMKRLGESISLVLPKGAGPAVTKTATTIYRNGGEAALRKVAKLHFSITSTIVNANSPNQDSKKSVDHFSEEGKCIE